MLCRDVSSEANRTIARTSAFLANLAAEVSGSFGELMLQYLAIKREDSSSVPHQNLCCCPYETFCHFSALGKIYNVLVF